MILARTLEIGGHILPLHAGHRIVQTYEEIGGRALLRFADGSGLVQSSWTRLKTVIQGEGSRPPGMAMLPTGTPLIMKCAGERTIVGGTSIVLPAARRADAGSTPSAYAQLGQVAIETAMSLAGDTATLTPVAGAELYWVRYYPQISVYCETVRDQVDVLGGVFGWTLTAEEV